jgi:signal transduction histidine kinase
MSHEIRTPMSAILAAAGLLRRTELSPKQARYVRILQSSSDNLIQLLNNILDLSKLEAGKATLEEKPFALRELVDQSVLAQSGRAEEKGLKLLAEVDERLPRFVSGDPVRIGQVLTNLLSNAIKFTERGRVTVRARPTARLDDLISVEFRVIDTGMGIPADRQARIFEDFTQASQAIGGRYGGTGLGLAISKRLVEMHGGTLGVQSTEGEGSTFHFTVRLKIPEPPEDGLEASEAPPSR